MAKILGISDTGNLVARDYNHETKQLVETTLHCDDLEGLLLLIDFWGISGVSSQIDFPEESTDDETVIRLCRELRG